MGQEEGREKEREKERDCVCERERSLENLDPAKRKLTPFID